ncbi:MAG: Methyltransferase type 11 [Pseudonocardiales bacterium]|nr:Methyltransferase type 11 [Pseudonocardiales bacterium]
MVQPERSEQALAFGSVAQVYDRIRPGYPGAAIEFALNDVDAHRIMDLGAGTGLLTRELLGRGAEVVAVEPDAGMRAVLTAAMPIVEALDGTAEDLPFQDQSFDAVFVGQAFHWFRRPQAEQEIGRVLRSGGALAILTNTNSPDANWEGVLYERVLGAPQPSLAAAPAPLIEELFRDETVHFLDNPQRLSRPEFLTLASTWGWVAASDADQQARIAEAASVLADEIQDAAGLIPMPYVLRTVRAARR